MKRWPAYLKIEAAERAMSPAACFRQLSEVYAITHTPNVYRRYAPLPHDEEVARSLIWC